MENASSLDDALERVGMTKREYEKLCSEQGPSEYQEDLLRVLRGEHNLEEDTSLPDSDKIMRKFNNYFKRELDQNLKATEKVLAEKRGEFGTAAGFYHSTEFEGKTGIDIDNILESTMVDNENEEPLPDEKVAAIRQYRDHLYHDRMDAVETLVDQDSSD